MTDVDVKTTKKRGAVGRPKKVVKSPKKNSRPDSGDKCNDDFDYCPCKNYIDEELSVECESCNKYWHLCCVGLGGLKEDMVQLLVNWKCQDCFTCPYSYKDTTGKQQIQENNKLNLYHEKQGFTLLRFIKKLKKRIKILDNPTFYQGIVGAGKVTISS